MERELTNSRASQAVTIKPWALQQQFETKMTNCVWTLSIVHGGVLKLQ
jgi:hypothetical protein